MSERNPVHEVVNGWGFDDRGLGQFDNPVSAETVTARWVAFARAILDADAERRGVAFTDEPELTCWKCGMDRLTKDDVPAPWCAMCGAKLPEVKA